MWWTESQWLTGNIWRATCLQLQLNACLVWILWTKGRGRLNHCEVSPGGGSKTWPKHCLCAENQWPFIERPLATFHAGVSSVFNLHFIWMLFNLLTFPLCRSAHSQEPNQVSSPILYTWATENHLTKLSKIYCLMSNFRWSFCTLTGNCSLSLWPGILNMWSLETAATAASVGNLLEIKSSGPIPKTLEVESSILFWQALPVFVAQGQI